MILIVDDYSELGGVLERYVRVFGCKGHCLTDATKVLETVEQLRPSLLFLDDEMPCISGLEVLRLLRESPQPDIASLPVVMFSAATLSVRHAEAAQLGALAWVMKHDSLTKLDPFIKQYGRSSTEA